MTSYLLLVSAVVVALAPAHKDGGRPAAPEQAEAAERLQLVVSIAGQRSAKKGGGKGRLDLWLGIRNGSTKATILSSLDDASVTLFRNGQQLTSVSVGGISHCRDGSGSHLVLPGETFFELFSMSIGEKEMSATSLEAHASLKEAPEAGTCGTRSIYLRGRFALGRAANGLFLRETSPSGTAK